MLMGRYRTLYYALDPFLVALYATPGVALIPLIMLWLGLGLPAKVVIISFQAQHLWAYQNARIAMETPVTTGIRGVTDPSSGVR